MAPIFEIKAKVKNFLRLSHLNTALSDKAHSMLRAELDETVDIIQKNING